MLKKLTKNLNPASFDFYGTIPAIQIQGQTNSYSKVGIFSSIIVIGFIIWASVINASELYQKKNPSLITVNLPASTFTQSIEISPDIFDFSFGMLDLSTYTLYADPTIYTVEAVFHANPSNPSEDISLEMEECSPQYIREIAEVTGPLWCLKKQQTHLSKIKVKTKQASYMSVNFKRCNTTATNTCASSNAINARLANSLFGRVYSDWKIDPFNYKQPIQRYYRADWNGVLLTQTRVVYLYLATTEFTSDNGLILPSLNTRNVVTVQSTEVDEASSLPDGTFSILSIANSGNKIVYSRSYIKIQDVLAQIGGLCSGFIFIVGLLVKPYSKVKMYENLINKAFHVSFDPQDKPGSSKQQDLKNDTSVIKALNAQSKKENNTTYEEPSKIEHYNKHNELNPENSSVMNISRGADQAIYNLTQKKIMIAGIDASDSAYNTIAPENKGLSVTIPNIIEANADLSFSRIEDKPKPNKDIEAYSLDDSLSPPQKRPLNAENTTNINHQNKRIYEQRASKLSKISCWKRLKMREVSPLPIQDRPKSLSIGYFEFIFSPILPKAKLKIEAIERGSQQIMLQLDFLTMFRKLAEMDRLKMYLLTPGQRTTFDGLNIPTLSVNMRRSDKNERKIETDLTRIDWDERYVPSLANQSLRKEGCISMQDLSAAMNYERNKSEIELMSRKG